MAFGTHDIPEASLVISTGRSKQFPPAEYPEIAFAGRSNVGKSSLINLLAQRKKLARSSSSPGKTRTINFFDITCIERSDSIEIPDTRHIFRFVDLPGYGYAKVSHSESDSWKSLVNAYFNEHQSRKTMVILLDIRHEPNANDKMLWEWCSFYGIPTILAATKSDKIKPSQIAKHLSTISRCLESRDAPLIPVSCHTNDGRVKLWSTIMDINKNM